MAQLLFKNYYLSPQNIIKNHIKNCSLHEFLGPLIEAAICWRGYGMSVYNVHTQLQVDIEVVGLIAFFLETVIDKR